MPCPRCVVVFALNRDFGLGEKIVVTRVAGMRMLGKRMGKARVNKNPRTVVCFNQITGNGRIVGQNTPHRQQVQLRKPEYSRCRKG